MSTLDGSDVATLRRLNSRLLLAALQPSQPSRTVSELARTTKLSRPTVEASLASLVTEGWVREQPPAQTRHRAGRPAKRYAFDAARRIVLGVDLGPHGVTVEVADLRGESLSVVHSDEIDLTQASVAFRETQDAVHRAVADAGVSLESVICATFGIPGVVSDSGDVVRTTVVPGWMGPDLIRGLGRLLPGVRVFVENDAKLAALAEQEWGHARGVRSAVCLLVGHRLGASVITQGSLLRGSHGAAGEIGALPSTLWGFACRHLNDSGDDPAAVFARADSGDHRASMAVDAFVAELATGLAVLCLAVDPEVVIVGGGVAAAGAALLDRLEVALRPLVLFEPEIEVSSLERVVVRGAVARSLSFVRHELLDLSVASGLPGFPS
ncbi:ROK family transcriptional regulator [Leifsonia xyli subsp. cynodontis DSM 46306]|uniref:HTH marR-type domain-containing protein n=1 Tax=Leifsonia xyli subsp. cynodontis DSM 46306 TaxID=1389489 RepID=U3PAB8_LEIXC|nr:ROK family transcriptional regulator [Leifsonia xyli]AGW41772.1 ROK family transcriptional regulator [Leifsonia xyli subsp. cynodontis DSM 46306]